MKPLIITVLFFLISNFSFSQKLFNDNIEDTLSIDNFGKRIELENDLTECERLNDILLVEIIRRKKIENCSELAQKYYKNVYLASLLNKAYFHNKKGNYKKEIAIYYEILKDKNASIKVLSYTYNAIGISFAEIGELHKSIYYCKKSLIYHKKVNNIEGITNINDNLGDLYTRINQLEKALFFFKQSIYYGSKSYNKDILGSVYNNIASVYRKKKEYQKAIDNYNKGIEISINSKNNTELSQIYYNLGETYYDIGNDELSEAYKTKSFQTAEFSKNLTILRSAGKDLYRIYKKKQQLNKALFYLETSVNAKDTLEKADNKNAILKAEFNHETEKKENQIKLLSQEKKIAELKSERQTTLVFVLITLFISIGAVSYFLFNRYKIKKQNELLRIELEEAQKTIEAEKKAAESELKALKSQMNPHFIFNALNSIQEQFMFGDKITANEQMGNFTYLTRQILEVSGKKKIAIATEIEILTKYLELEKMRFDNDFEYFIDIDPAVDDDYIQIPPMLIQPFVENSIKHGLLHKKGYKEVRLLFELDASEKNLICTIQDNGIGRKKSNEIKVKNQSKHSSFSTQSIDQRLEIWNKNTGNAIVYEDLLTDTDEVIGTKVVLTIAIY